MDVRAGLTYELTHSNRVLRVFYEDLVKEPEEVLKAIFEFLDMDSTGMTISGEKKTQEYSDFYENIHVNLERSPTPAFIDKWKQHLSSEAVLIVEGICGELMGELGYECSSTSDSPPAYTSRKARSQRVKGILRQMGRYLRYRRSYLFHLIWRKWKLGLLKDFLWTVNY
jgi:hypothetical protein